jgi:hypothetical protein
VSPNLGLGFDTLLTHLSGLSVSLDREHREQLRGVAFNALADTLYSLPYNRCTAVQRASIVLIWIRIEDHLANTYLVAEPKSSYCIFC